MRRFSALANSLIAIGFVGGALTAAGQVIIRGNNGKVIITGAFSNGQEKKAEPDPAGPHLIEFFDGRQLHGTLEAVDLKQPPAAFAMNMNLFGRKVAKFERVPVTWSEAAKKHDVRIVIPPDDLFKHLWPD